MMLTAAVLALALLTPHPMERPVADHELGDLILRMRHAESARRALRLNPCNAASEYRLWEIELRGAVQDGSFMVRGEDGEWYIYRLTDAQKERVNRLMSIPQSGAEYAQTQCDAERRRRRY